MAVPDTVLIAVPLRSVAAGCGRSRRHRAPQVVHGPGRR
jgi:hypothetical protein